MQEQEAKKSSELFEEQQKMVERERDREIDNLQTELYKLQKKYQAFFELTNDAMTIVDLEGIYLEINERAAELFGYSREELIGRSVYELIPSSEEKKAKEKHQLVLQGERMPFYERILKRKDGTEITVLLKAQLIRDEFGKPIYVLNAISDISERKKFEESIMKQAEVILKSKKETEKSEEEKIRILNSMLEHVIYYEEGHKIKWANAAAARSISKEQQEIPGKYCYVLWAQRDSVCEGCPVKIARETLIPQTSEMTTPDGRIWLVRGLPIVEEGKLKAVVEITQEITEMKKAQEKIEKLNVELERRVKERTAELKITNEELKAFSYSVSHDLRAPIRRIKSYIDLITKQCSQELEQKEKIAGYLQAINQSTEEMDEYIEGMLILSRVTQTELVMKEIDLKELVEGIIEKNKNEYAGREINWVIADDLPVVEGDQTLLQLALTNVLLNSIKFTQKQEEPVIVIGYDGNQSDAFHEVFYIRDNGIGFEMKYVDKLFSAFQRLHHEKEYQGTGIGLATVKRIMLRHHGSVWGESEETKGTTIYFSLPKKLP